MKDQEPYFHLALFSDDLTNEINLEEISKDEIYHFKLELHNLGDLKASLREVKVDSGKFEIKYDDSCLRSLKPKQVCHFNVRVKAKTKGLSEGFLSFSFISDDGQSQSVGLFIGGRISDTSYRYNPFI